MDVGQGRAEGYTGRVLMLAAVSDNCESTDFVRGEIPCKVDNVVYNVLVV